MSPAKGLDSPPLSTGWRARAVSMEADSTSGPAAVEPFSMDLSAGALVASLVVSSLGLGLFLYGKRELRYPQLAVGFAMMAFPYFVSSAAVTWGLGAALALALVIAVRAGL